MQPAGRRAGQRAGTAALRGLLVVVSGLALAASFEPYDLPVLLPFGVAGFALALRGVRARRGAWLGLLGGAAFMYVHLFWMRSVGYDAWVLLGTLETAFFVPLGIATALVSRLRVWPLATAALWVAVEVWRSSYPFGGMPWGRLAYATADTPYAAALPYLGATGVGLLVALTGTALAWALLRVRRAPRAVSVAALAAAAAIALPNVWTYAATPDGEVTVAAIQGDVPGPGTDILYDHRQVTQNHVDVTVQLAADAEAGKVPAPDLVLWPENATALDPFLDAPLNDEIREAVAAVGVPILVGAIVDDPRPGKILNQGIVWDPVTGAADRYTKRHPVPYGEYIPWRDSNPLTSRFDELARVARDMQAGTRLSPLRVSGIPVADAICFDVAYDEGIYAQLRGGARLLVVQTSNATFSRTSQLDQQFDITRVRAIETGRHVAVASTNGITGIIGPDGRPTSVLERRTQGYVVETVPLTSDVPPGIRVGPALGRAAVIVSICALAWALAWALVPYRRRRSGRPAGHPDDRADGQTPDRADHPEERHERARR